MLSIRLSRVGKKNKPMYRVVIMERGRDPFGRALEILGSYNPHSKDLQAKGERINYWISKGAQMTPTVNNLLIDKGIIKGEKVSASKQGKKKKAEENSKAPAPTETVAETKPEEATTTPEKKEETVPTNKEVKPAENTQPKEEVRAEESKPEKNSSTEEKQA